MTISLSEERYFTIIVGPCDTPVARLGVVGHICVQQTKAIVEGGPSSVREAASALARYPDVRGRL